jgi:hypothetical protein
MKITIDTNDSKEDIRKAIDFLKTFLEETEAQGVFNIFDAHDTAEKREPDDEPDDEPEDVQDDDLNIKPIFY